MKKKTANRRRSNNRQLSRQKNQKQENLPEELPDKEDPEVVSKLEKGSLTEYLVSASFKGPLPPPALFEHYEQALTGSVDRILRLAENEQRHRHEWEHTALQAQKGDNKRGQTFGFLIGLAGLVSTVACAALGKEHAALASAGVVIAGIVSTFFKRTRQTEADENLSSE